MELAPFSNVMQREARQGPVGTTQAGSIPASRPKPLIQSQQQAEACSHHWRGTPKGDPQG